MPSAALQQKILEGTLKMAGVSLADNGLPAAIQVRHAVTGNGKTTHFYLNFSGAACDIAYGYGEGADILSGKPAERGRKIALPAWDLAIIQEK
jgi:beta-galactosidase